MFTAVMCGLIGEDFLRPLLAMTRPLSSDGAQVKPAPPNKPSGKNRGMQTRHPKHERIILSPDEVIDHKPARCCQSAIPLADDDPVGSSSGCSPW